MKDINKVNKEIYKACEKIKKLNFNISKNQESMNCDVIFPSYAKQLKKFNKEYLNEARQIRTDLFNLVSKSKAIRYLDKMNFEVLNSNQIDVIEIKDILINIITWEYIRSNNISNVGSIFYEAEYKEFCKLREKRKALKIRYKYLQDNIVIPLIDNDKELQLIKGLLNDMKTCLYLYE